MELDKLETMVKIIHAITALHNFCIDENEFYHFDKLDVDMERGNQPSTLRICGSASKDAMNFRDSIAQKLFYET